MKKLLKGIVGVASCCLLFSYNGWGVKAEEPTAETLAVSGEYARAYTFNGYSSWTSYPYSESSAYSWIISTADKGYVKDGSSNGALLGVVLNDTTIDFSYSYLIQRGSTGSKVKAVQSTLNCLGYNAGPVDGIFGSQTVSAVKSFQRDHGLVVDGIVGKNTYYYLSFAKK